jgi:AcrR family transcriptional regulator
VEHTGTSIPLTLTTVTQKKPDSAGKLDRVERTLRADARRNREAVIAAARQLFADQGLDAQMPDVAKAAKVGVGTVYRHFPTKDDLIAALVADRFERLAQTARDGLEAEDPWEGISDFIRYSAQIQADDRGLCEVMGSRPEVMDAAARAAGLSELCERLVKRASPRPGLGGHPDDRLWAWPDHAGEHRARDRPVATPRRDHPRRPAGARDREAAAGALSTGSGPEKKAPRRERSHGLRRLGPS